MRDNVALSPPLMDSEPTIPQNHSGSCADTEHYFSDNIPAE